MRLLVLTPGELTRDQRARREVVAARSLGWDVVGLCGQFHTDEPQSFDGVPVARLPRGGQLARVRSAGGGSVRRKALGLRELRGLYQLLRRGSKTVRFLRRGRTLGTFSVVHANDLDTLPAGWLLARRSRARLVYDAHELYTEQMADPPRVHRAVAGAIEHLLARRADAVATVSEPLAREIGLKLGLERPPIVVLNCPSRDDAGEPEPSNGPLRVVYQAGGITEARPLDDLYAAAASLDSVRFTLLIASVDPDELRADVRRRGLGDHVAVGEPVPVSDMVAALRPFEVGLVIDRPVSRNNELGFPNKLFEYLMAGLAVAVPHLPTMGPFVEREQVGVTYEPGRPELLAARLRHLAADRALLLELRRRARAAALGRYNAEAQAGALAQAWGA